MSVMIIQYLFLMKQFLNRKHGHGIDLFYDNTGQLLLLPQSVEVPGVHQGAVVKLWS